MEVDAHRHRCGLAPLRGERAPTRAGEDLEVLLVGELGVRDSEFPLEVGAADLLEPPIRLRVDARDEEARHGGHPREIATRLRETLEPAKVRLGDLRMPREREDERHVDRAAAGDGVLDRAQPGLRAGDLDVGVVPTHELVQPHRLVERRLAVVGELWIDLDRDVAVDPAGSLPGPVQEIARTRHVLHGQLEEDLLRVVVPGQCVAELIVVPGPGRERLLEDRRVGGDADDGVLLHEPRELARLQHLPR